MEKIFRIFKKTLEVFLEKSSGRQTPPVNAIVIFDINEILKSSGWINKDRDQMFIIDQVNHRLVSNAPMEEEKQNQIIKLTEEHNQNSAVKKQPKGVKL